MYAGLIVWSLWDTFGRDLVLYKKKKKLIESLIDQLNKPLSANQTDVSLERRVDSPWSRTCLAQPTRCRRIAATVAGDGKNRLTGRRVIPSTQRLRASADWQWLFWLACLWKREEKAASQSWSLTEIHTATTPLCLSLGIKARGGFLECVKWSLILKKTQAPPSEREAVGGKQP